MTDETLENMKQVAIQREEGGTYTLVGTKLQGDKGKSGWLIESCIQSTSIDNTYWVSEQRFYAADVSIPLPSDGTDVSRIQTGEVPAAVDPNEKKAILDAIELWEKPVRQDQKEISAFYEKMTAFKLTESQAEDLSEWGKQHLDGSTVATSDWPGWEPLIGKKP